MHFLFYYNSPCRTAGWLIWLIMVGDDTSRLWKSPTAYCLVLRFSFDSLSATNPFDRRYPILFLAFIKLIHSLTWSLFHCRWFPYCVLYIIAHAEDIYLLNLWASNSCAIAVITRTSSMKFHIWFTQYRKQLSSLDFFFLYKCFPVGSLCNCVNG